MANKLFINGKDVTEDITTGFEKFNLELGLNSSTKTVGKILSSDITLKGDTYELLRDLFFKTCSGWQNSIKGIFKTDICGGISTETEITSEGAEWCPEKENIVVNLKSSDEVSRAYNRLDSETITDNGFIETNDTPIMYFASQPSWMLYLLIIVVAPIRVALNVIDVTLKLICEVVTFTTGECNINLSRAAFGHFDTWITGLGRWAPAPLLREMIEYQCTSTGIKFKSSILNNPLSPYYNLSMFCLTGGTYGDNKNTTKSRVIEVFKENAPLYTTIDLLKELSLLFKSDYRIINDTLYFEREDFFDDIRTKKLFNTEDFCLDDPICIKTATIDACAYGEYSYTPDALDQDGNKTYRKHYRGRREFNKPYNPAQKGKCTKQFKFGPSRFMFDQWLSTTKGFFNFDLFIDAYRIDPTNWIAENLLTQDGIKRNNDLIITGNSLSYEKLLVLENNFQRKDAKVVKRSFIKRGKAEFWIYNEPMHIDQLYDNFLYLDNPRLNKKRFTINDFKIDCNCEIVKDVVQNFQELFIENPNTKIIPGKVSIDFDEEKISISFSELTGLCLN